MLTLTGQQADAKAKSQTKKWMCSCCRPELNMFCDFQLKPTIRTRHHVSMLRKVGARLFPRRSQAALDRRLLPFTTARVRHFRCHRIPCAQSFIVCVFPLNVGKRKREEDNSLLDVLREMEETNLELTRSDLKHRERFLRQMLHMHAEEMELRRQELAFLREDAEKARQQEMEFQTGFLAVMDRLVQTLGQKP